MSFTQLYWILPFVNYLPISCRISSLVSRPSCILYYRLLAGVLDGRPKFYDLWCLWDIGLYPGGAHARDSRYRRRVKRKISLRFSWTIMSREQCIEWFIVRVPIEINRNNDHLYNLYAHSIAVPAPWWRAASRGSGGDRSSAHRQMPDSVTARVKC